MGNKRLLIVDDDPDIRESLSLALEESYRVSTACDGAEALSLLERDPSFDGVILDLMMPVLDGEAVIGELRRRQLGIPVLLTSASLNVARTAERLGAMDYLPKPFQLDALEDKVARLVAESELVLRA